MKHINIDSPDELSDLLTKYGFDSKDKLEKKEATKAICKLFHVHPTKDDTLVQRIFSLFDSTHPDGAIDYEEFVTAVHLIFKGSVMERLTFSFNSFDLNGDGKISRIEFQRAIAILWKNKNCQERLSFILDESHFQSVDDFVCHNYPASCSFLEFSDWSKIATKFLSTVCTDKTMDTQIGGHTGAFKQTGDGRVIKITLEKEYRFYKSLSTQLSVFSPFCPRFFETIKDAGVKKVVMEDLVSPFSKPCILDVKMGTSTVDMESSGPKKETMHKKDLSSTSSKVGMRACGAKVWDVKTNEYVSRGKDWGKSLTEQNFAFEAIEKFFYDGEKVRTKVARNCLAKVKTIYDLFEKQHLARFFSSSLLFIYEGDQSQEKDVVVKMIDFAHVYEITDGGRDEGYLFGLKKLIEFLQNVCDKHPENM